MGFAIAVILSLSQHGVWGGSTELDLDFALLDHKEAQSRPEGQGITGDSGLRSAECLNGVWSHLLGGGGGVCEALLGGT